VESIRSLAPDVPQRVLAQDRAHRHGHDQEGRAAGPGGGGPAPRAVVLVGRPGVLRPGRAQQLPPPGAGRAGGAAPAVQAGGQPAAGPRGPGLSAPGGAARAAGRRAGHRPRGLPRPGTPRARLARHHRHPGAHLLRDRPARAGRRGEPALHRDGQRVQRSHGTRFRPCPAQGPPDRGGRSELGAATPGGIRLLECR
jgi:hypothetical protein